MEIICIIVGSIFIGAQFGLYTGVGVGFLTTAICLSIYFSGEN